MQVFCIIGWLLQKLYFILYFLLFLNKLTELHKSCNFNAEKP